MPISTPVKTRVPLDPARTALLLAGQRSLWEPLVEFDPSARYYTRLAKEPNFEAWLLTWLPGQGTEWHDHGGSAGAFITLRGTLSEQHAVVSPDGPPVLQQGNRAVDAGVLRAFGRRHIHQVVNQGSDPAVSLHVYSPALSTMNRYLVVGRRLQHVALESAGVDW